MDHAILDRIARRLASHTTRRRVIALLGLAATPALTPPDPAGASAVRRRTRRPSAQGPCGSGKRKDNICTKNSDCCTGICNTKAGKTNRDRKGRCRCVRFGGKCTADRNCCRRDGMEISCVNRLCGPAAPPPPPDVPTGQPCVEGVDTCTDPAASCTTYFQTATPGTFCLLPNGGACAANGDCRSEDCTGGVCAVEVCDVCASGCPYTTVQAALDAPPASGAVIRIDAGTYDEDLTAPAVAFTLTNCNGSEPVLRNASDDTRTLVIGTSSDPAPHPTVTISNITITGKGTPVAGDPYPITDPTVGDGGIDAYTNLILDGTAKVTGCNWLRAGGGVVLKPVNEILTVTVRGSAEVSNNYAGGEGGGIAVDSYAGAGAVLEGNALVTGNYSFAGGGGVYAGYECILRMSGSSTVSHNRGDSNAGGVYVYGYSSTLSMLIMRDQSSIVFNQLMNGAGGGAAVGATDGPWSIEMHDQSLIADNTAPDSGGGFYLTDKEAKALLDGAALVTRNTAASGAGAAAADDSGTAVAVVDIRENARIVANTPDNCEAIVIPAGGKQCGV